jgi:hypothetical protein
MPMRDFKAIRQRRFFYRETVVIGCDLHPTRFAVQ